MMPISLAEVGQSQIIKKIGGSPEVKKHLEDLGFRVGGEISVVNTIVGNLIVNVKECRVAKQRAGKCLLPPESCKAGNLCA